MGDGAVAGGGGDAVRVGVTETQATALAFSKANRLRYAFAMSDVVDVGRAADELGLHPSRVRALIADGSLRGDKVGGRWLVHWHSVVSRRREPAATGRPLTARNAWTLLLESSGEALPAETNPSSLWRIRETLRHQGLVAVRGRLERRASVQRLWALPGELRRVLDDDALALTGSSAAGALDLGLAAPDTVDAYLPASRVPVVVREHGLEAATASQSNLVLRAVPDEAWFLDARRVAPTAAVALDLASYLDSRSSRAGMDLLQRLDDRRTGE